MNADVSRSIASCGVFVVGLSALLGISTACGLNPQPLPPDTVYDSGVPISVANPSVTDDASAEFGGGGKTSSSSSGTGAVPPPEADAGAAEGDAANSGVPGTGSDAGHRGADAAADASPLLDAAIDADRRDGGDGGERHDAQKDAPVRDDASDDAARADSATTS
jgi:hypothetical protein